MFCPTTATSKKRLLIVDGHGSHETDDFMWTCFSNNIYLLFLPGHASHVLQPLNLSVFSLLKTTYRRGINDLTVMTDCAPIGKRLFLRRYAQAKNDAIKERNIRSGWKASGLWPVNLDKPLMSRLLLNPTSQSVSQPVKSNVIYYLSGHFPAPHPTTSTSDSLHYAIVPGKMPKPLQHEDKIQLALEALRSGQIKSIRKAAAAFDVPNRILQERVKGVLHVNKRKSRVESYSRPKNLP
ncbi:hypothetical protein CHGG_00474 [Chaetomium globosum CBS 148.51]|uniref:DDE-1 domain-containing protein n=1 Tax=Chaetomium globosum (strain ATCC 6205 / CBS 148.51 / DSM 1962 / NBRC 6347 / NRRL 1970) TaxID=306901 RepID=Q2HH30_CHAGB|nr:uncharacterized protein CHGG_00474 [Chaetomium globosum CBS 148.51]EAQ92239.1 hypothetical protein CHGG_00474 [Chaetomium globosum CBS 148.51]